MDIKEIKDEKAYIELKISQYITEFEEKTGTRVSNLKIRREPREDGQETIVVVCQVLIPYIGRGAGTSFSSC